MKILVTGGAGFIGSALIRHLLTHSAHRVLNLDCLSYAGNTESLSDVDQLANYQFVRGDIRDPKLVAELLSSWQPDAIMHLAAESHVDRSIDAPDEFITTNINGTYCLLEQCRHYWGSLSGEQRRRFRFHHISTDEVYGDLAADAPAFTEATPYAPSSPYAASKAASDHLVRAWARTFGLPVLITNCSNNYGPYQFPEKLIPHIIVSALRGAALPVYGDGGQIRDWLYVEDHARALLTVLEQGSVGDTYNVGGHNEMTNLSMVESVCTLLDELAPGQRSQNIKSYKELITFVSDRPGHDRRYAINADKIAAALSWQPQETPASGLRKTVQWYLDNQDWWQRVLDGSYQLERLGQNA